MKRELLSKENLKKRIKEIYKGFLKVISIVLTKQCFVECEHCYIGASKKEKMWFDMRKLKNLIKRIKNTSKVKIINLTGGEPFIKFDFLKNVVEFISYENIWVMVYTSAFWCKNEEIAKERISSLKKAGLKLLMTSWDIFHSKAIPLNNVKILLKVAAEYDIPIGISIVKTEYDSAIVEKIKLELKNLIDEDFIFTQMISLVGKAQHLSNKFNYLLQEEIPEGVCNTMVPFIYPDGDFYACCGMVERLTSSNPLYRGNVNFTPIEQIFDELEKDYLIHALRVIPFSKLAQLAIKGGANLKNKRYIKTDICALCYDIFSNPTVTNFLKETFNHPYWQRKIKIFRKILYQE